jgi:hypothetical protein
MGRPYAFIHSNSAMMWSSILERFTPLLSTFMTNGVAYLVVGADQASFIVNICSLVSWGFILADCCTRVSRGELSQSPPTPGLYQDMDKAVLSLEGVCLVEVTRIALGSVGGNLALGVVLHYTRIFIWVNVIGLAGVQNTEWPITILLACASRPPPCPQPFAFPCAFPSLTPALHPTPCSPHGRLCCPVCYSSSRVRY